MTDIHTRILNNDEYNLWDNLVSNSDYGTLFHKIGWLKICEESFDKKLEIYGCFKNEKLIGGYALFIEKYQIFTRAVATCSTTPYGGVLIRKSMSTKVREQESFRNNVLKSILNNLKMQKLDRIIIHNSPQFIDIRQFTYNNWNTLVKYTYYFDLTLNIEDTLSKEMKQTIKKAQQNDIRINKENNHELFYTLYRSTYENQGIKIPASSDFFKKVIEYIELTGNGQMWIARTSTEDVASAEIILWDKDQAYRWTAGSNNQLKSTGSTSLLLYNILVDLKNNRFKTIDLMGGNIPKLSKFISSFNPKLVPYYSLELYSTKYMILSDINKLKN